MAINYPGPYSIEYEYIFAGLAHKLQLNCIATGNPVAGTPLSGISLQTASGGALAANLAVEQLWGFLRPMHGNQTSVSGVTLWKYLPNSFEKTFISSYSGALAVGSNANQGTYASQAILSFRTGAGGIMYINLLEVVSTANTQTALVPSATGSAWAQLANYVLGANGWMIGRDNGYPIAAYRLSFGQNEKIWRKRHRNV